MHLNVVEQVLFGDDMMYHYNFPLFNDRIPRCFIIICNEG